MKKLLLSLVLFISVIGNISALSLSELKNIIVDFEKNGTVLYFYDDMKSEDCTIIPKKSIVHYVTGEKGMIFYYGTKKEIVMFDEYSVEQDSDKNIIIKRIGYYKDY